MEEAEHKWVSRHEEEEAVVGLQARRSRHGHGKTSIDGTETKPPRKVAEYGSESTDEAQGLGSIENVVEAAEFRNSSTVYFDRDQGTESADVESFSSPSLQPAVKQSYEEENTNVVQYLIQEEGEEIVEEELEVADLDVKGVIENQEIYDLICPNCHSCITKKVILVTRKPKPRNDKPLQQATPENDDGLGGADSISSINDPMPPKADVFRCLSCFSFFIPSENGLFRIFRGKQETQTIQNPNATSRNSFLAFFGAYKGTRASNETTTAVEQSTVKPSSSAQSPEEAIKDLEDGSNGLIHSTREPLLYNSETKVDKVTTDTQMQYATLPDKDDLPSTVQYYAPPSVQPIFKANDGAEEGQTMGKDSLNSSIHQDTVTESVVTSVPQKSPDAVDQSKTESNDNVMSTERRSKAAAPEGTSTQTDTRIDVGEPVIPEAREWEILKSIVYGGLIESITSLGIVSSAAGAGARTLNILGLALANLIGGLFVVAHNVEELRSDSSRGTSTDRYVEQLGQRDQFKLHVVTVILSFLIFGAIPPILYGFSFRESDDRDLKLAVVAAASLVCITLLATGKAHFKNPRESYFKTILYYVSIGFMTSGVSYVVGDLFDKLLKYLGLFDSSLVMTMEHKGWALY